MSVWGLIRNPAKMYVHFSLEFMVWFRLSSLCLSGLLSQLDNAHCSSSKSKRGQVQEACVWAWSPGCAHEIQPFPSHTCHCPFKGEHSLWEMFTEQEDSVIMETFCSSTLSLIVFPKGALSGSNNWKHPSLAFLCACGLGVRHGGTCLQSQHVGHGGRRIRYSKLSVLHNKRKPSRGHLRLYCPSLPPPPRS